MTLGISLEQFCIPDVFIFSPVLKKSLDELNEFQWMHLCSKWPEELSQELEIRRHYFRIVNEVCEFL